MVHIVARCLVLAGCLVAVVGLLFPATASAHEPGATLLTVATTEDTVELRVSIPLERLDAAYGTELAADPEAAVSAAADRLTSLVEAGIDVTSADGAAWTLTTDTLDVVELDSIDNLAVYLTATPPQDEPVESFTVRDEVVTEVIYSHKVFVAESAPIGENGDTGEAQLLGTITHFQPTLQVDAAEQAEPVTFASMVRVGVEHFREGTDHLLFLTLVGLAAAVRKARPRPTVARLAVLTLCFTLGHSVSLVLAALGWVSLPTVLMETAIAVTILLAAVHSIRPLISSRTEVLTTVGFGLIHGLGFAGTLGELSLQGAQVVVPVLGFNLGLELAQVAALVLIAAPLWVLARSTAAVRVLAGVVAVVAITWIAERAVSLGNPLEAAVRAAAGTPERLALVLAAGALLVLLARRLRHRHRGHQHHPVHGRHAPLPQGVSA